MNGFTVQVNDDAVTIESETVFTADGNKKITVTPIKDSIGIAFPAAALQGGKKSRRRRKGKGKKGKSMKRRGTRGKKAKK